MTIDEAVEQAAKHCDNRQFEQAEAIARQVLAQQPRHARAFFILAVTALYNLNRPLAKQLMEVAINLDPNVPEFRVGYAAAIRYDGEFVRAAEMLQDVARHWPHCAEAYDHLSTAYEKMRMMPEALAAGEKAISMRPTIPSFHITRATQLLMLGDYPRGWYEYEWRWFDGRMLGSRHDFKVPWWEGQPGEGQTILFTAEQGIGDTFMAVRYAALAAERGLRVVVGCQPEILQVISRAQGVSGVARDLAEAGTFHLQLPLMSLLRLFAPSPDEVRREVPYITADPQKVRQWGQKMREMEEALRRHPPQAPGHPPVKVPADGGVALRVGLAWCGNPRQDDNQYRSMHLADYAPLADVPGVIFYGIQKGDAGLEAKDPPPGMAFIDIAPDFNDFADTAAVMENLDLIITIDSSPAHLSGALGRPTWAMICHCNAWQWLIGRTDSPWYPTARLFRQEKLFDWTAPVNRAREALLDLARQRAQDGDRATALASTAPQAVNA